MITLADILKGAKLEDQTEKVQYDLQVLVDRYNLLLGTMDETEAKKFRTVTSGFRTKEDHIRVYKELAAKRGQEFDETKIPWGSMHLRGCAVDISDPTGWLYTFAVNRESVLEEIGLWCEVKDDQERVHFQTEPPRSNKRFFHP
jgi:hypothetical protein